MDGSKLGDPSNDCYIPVFFHGLSGVTDAYTIMIGNSFMKKNYVVYDMSPLDTHGKDYI